MMMMMREDGSCTGSSATLGLLSRCRRSTPTRTESKNICGWRVICRGLTASRAQRSVNFAKRLMNFNTTNAIPIDATMKQQMKESSMGEQIETDQNDPTSGEAMLEDAHRLRRISSELAACSAGVETLLRADDLRAAHSAANLLSDWALNFSLRTGRLRDSIRERARNEAQQFLDETS
jgi:hypothetical protein